MDQAFLDIADLVFLAILVLQALQDSLATVVLVFLATVVQQAFQDSLATVVQPAQLVLVDLTHRYSTTLAAL